VSGLSALGNAMLVTSSTTLIGRRQPHAPLRLPLLFVSLVTVAAVALIGRQWTDTAPGSWYDGLSKPSWTPPGPAFGVVWSILYAAMAVAAWLVARHDLARPDVRRALVLYGVQLVLNLGWTATFFAAERPGWAIVEILALLAVIIALLFAVHPISRAAFYLLVPYAAWVAFATSLTIAIAALNR
jgi:tryptophan-rich sensory protein